MQKDDIESLKYRSFDSLTLQEIWKLLPESPIKTMKLAKLNTERTEIETQYADIVSNVIRLGGNDAIANLI